MFRSIGLFQTVPCPQGVACEFHQCIFSHSQVQNDRKDHTLRVDNPEDVRRIPDEQSPPVKRRRLSSAPNSSVPPADQTKPITKTLLPSNSLVSFDGDEQGEKDAPQSSSSSRPAPTKPSLVTVSRTVSPPSSRLSRKSSGDKVKDIQPSHEKTPANSRQPAKSVKISLTPRLLNPNPAPHSFRLAILKKFHEQISTLNEEVRKNPGTKREFVLSEDEIVTKALDEEEKAGRENPQIYKNVVGHRIQRFKKMRREEWETLLMQDFRHNYLPVTPSTKAIAKIFETGLNPADEIAILSHVVTPIREMSEHGYVTSVPSSTDIESAREGIKMAAGFERCDRCETRFQVFPGRNTDESSKHFGRLTSTEKGCTYHWARLRRPPKSLSSGGGEQESYHPCCHGAVGSKGCTEATDHVFKVTEVKRLASILQFESTPWPQDDTQRLRGPVAFDCEMCYTTLGMELVRLTAVSWPQHKRLLDVLVRPLGEVLDYNTRFSGVSQEQFSKAVLYTESGEKDSLRHNQFGETKAAASEEGKDAPTSGPTYFVDLPQAARKLLFDLVTPDTPLIGHAIENDLNCCRIIHPTIVDTVLLFPHPRGLPVRHGLKMLTSKYLNRTIQNGSSATTGHDSMEDAVATGDLVRFKVLEKWKKMKLAGWRLDDGRLIEPEESKKSAVVPAKQMAREEGGDRKTKKRRAAQLS